MSELAAAPVLSFCLALAAAEDTGGVLYAPLCSRGLAEARTYAVPASTGTSQRLEHHLSKEGRTERNRQRTTAESHSTSIESVSLLESAFRRCTAPCQGDMLLSRTKISRQLYERRFTRVAT